MSDEFYMNLALNEAWKYQLLTYPNPAVGCVIVKGEILSINSHKKSGFLHAEANAVFVALCEISDKFLSYFLRSYEQEFGVNLALICENVDNLIYGDLFKDDDILQSQKAIFANKILEFKDLNVNFIYDFILKNHNDLLKGAKAFVTLEPCSHVGKTPSCANLLVNLGFSEVFIGSKDENKKAKDGSKILQNHGINIKFDILKQRADELLEPFLAWQNGNFSVFKLGISANGVVKGGIISSKLSRTHSHIIRSLVDLLVIGGNTVRTDFPKLDTRLIKNAKNPDVLIYSKSKNFDKTLPLFKVKNRAVNMENSLDLAWNKNFVLFEGGENFLKIIPKNIAWLLLYRSSKFLQNENLSLDLNFKVLHEEKFAQDYIIWCKIN